MLFRSFGPLPPRIAKLRFKNLANLYNQFRLEEMENKRDTVKVRIPSIWILTY